MRTWEQIKTEIEEYKNHKLSLVTKFIKGKCVKCNVNGKTYYGRVNFTGFDLEKGMSYVLIKLNKNSKHTWISTGDNKAKFYDSDLYEIKPINNTFNKEKYKELASNLSDLDDLPLSKSDRESKQYEIEKEIMHLRQTKCIHKWEDVTEGSWINEKVVGYMCSVCGLRLDKDQELEQWEVQFELL